MKIVRYADREDLMSRRFEELTKPTFPEYMNQSETADRYWGRLYTDFADFQVALVDGDDLLAEVIQLSMIYKGAVRRWRPGETLQVAGARRALASAGCTADTSMPSTRLAEVLPACQL